MKVAQHEVLGNDAKKTRPSRRGTIETFAFESRMRLSGASIGRSSRPGRIGPKNAYPALRTGLFSPGSCGTDFLELTNDLCNPDSDLLS
jgi:hypothetical protein